jgi:hypothetical protein
MKIKITYPIKEGETTLLPGKEVYRPTRIAEEYIRNEWAVSLEPPKRKKEEAEVNDD